MFDDSTIKLRIRNPVKIYQPTNANKVLGELCHEKRASVFHGDLDKHKAMFIRSRESMAEKLKFFYGPY